MTTNGGQPTYSSEKKIGGGHHHENVGFKIRNVAAETTVAEIAKINNAMVVNNIRSDRSLASSRCARITVSVSTGAGMAVSIINSPLNLGRLNTP
jgi:hypothetical protein